MAKDRVKRAFRRMSSILAVKPGMVGQISDYSLNKVINDPTTPTAVQINARKEAANRLATGAAGQISPKAKRTTKYR